MGRPQFTEPTERPEDQASRDGSNEEFSEFDQSVSTSTTFTTVSQMTVSTNTSVAPVFVVGASLIYHGGVAESEDVQWRVEIEDSGDNQKWVKYGGSGGNGDGPLNVPGVKAKDGWDVNVQVRNQSGGSVNVSDAINYRT